MNKNWISKIRLGIETMNLPIHDDRIKQLGKFMEILLEENKKYNLTAINDPEEVISKHFLDSMAILTIISEKNLDKIIDIGTGAGFPGMVLKIYNPELKITLLDSLSKRIKYLNLIIDKLKLEGINTIHSRAEEAGQDNRYRENFDILVSRAVAPLKILYEYTLPLVKQGGKLYLYKGPDYIKEIDEAKNALKSLKGEIRQVYKLNVPFLRAERYILDIEKTGNTPRKYPRRPGIPKKRPL